MRYNLFIWRKPRNAAEASMRYFDVVLAGLYTTKEQGQYSTPIEDLLEPYKNSHTIEKIQGLTQ
jgi:hypothetical protein